MAPKEPMKLLIAVDFGKLSLVCHFANMSKRCRFITGTTFSGVAYLQTLNVSLQDSLVGQVVPLLMIKLPASKADSHPRLGRGWG
jgi:hypothetical protein